MAVSRTKARVALQSLSQERLSKDTIFDAIQAMLNHPSNPFEDRAAALVCVAFLEQALEYAITEYLPSLDDPITGRKLFEGDHEREGILGSLYSRAWMAHALGIFGPNTLSDIRDIGAIRNTFAHAKVPMSFARKEVADVCANLLLPRKLPDISHHRDRPIAKVRFIRTIEAQIRYLLAERPKPKKRLLWKRVVLGSLLD